MSEEIIDEKAEIARLIDMEVTHLTGIPPKYVGLRLRDAIPRNNEQHKLITYFLEMLEGEVWCTTVIGSVGNGKTTLATALVNEFTRKHISDGYRGRYETLRTLSGKITPSREGKYELVKELDKSPLLVIDELNPNPRLWSDDVKNFIEDLIDHREAYEKQLVLIGNLTPDDYKQMFDEQIKDRLGTGRKIVMTAPSMRTTNISTKEI